MKYKNLSFLGILSLMFCQNVLATEEIIFKNEELIELKQIDTTGNTVGIKPNEECFVIISQEDLGKPTVSILCKGTNKIRRFDNIDILEGSATGTPPGSMKNFIGSSLIGKKSNMPGASRRLVYCDGPCQKK